uniref:Ciliary associated calcium binding coiled-coil 1 n=1 Tax=Labrus bergylta TaxID=56723 RepID=A0A3Q3NHP1_9LABR|nr:uncharacterized protein cabcoco1 isoform X1 [Labrus bergylta]
MSAAESEREKKREEKDTNLQGPLTQQLISELVNKTDDQLTTELSHILGFTNHRLCLKEASLLDFYICGFSWMKQMKFSERQMSFVVNLLHLMVSNIRDKQMDLVQNLMVFIESLAHQCSTSDEETSVLNTEEVFTLIGYLKNSLFQKYNIYQHLLRSNRDELLTGAQRDVEVFGCQSICSLEEGLSAHLFHLKLQ